MTARHNSIDIVDVIRGDLFEAFFKIDILTLDISNKNIICEVKEFLDSEVAIITFSTADNSIVKTGQFLHFTKTANVMNVATGVYVYDVQFYTNEEDVVTLFGGQFKIISDVTR